MSNEHRKDQAIAVCISANRETLCYTDVVKQITLLIGIFVGWVELIAIVVAGLVIPPEDIGAGQALYVSLEST